MGATSTRCQGAGTVTYTATATTNTGITYTLDGASISGGNAINAGTGAVTYAAAWSGTSTITATAAGCNGPTTATHTVTITSSVSTPVFTLGATSTRCQGAGTVTYDATATTTTGITYTLDAASLAGTNAINGSTGVVTYAAGWSGTSVITASAAGCGGPKTATHTVTVTPTVGTPVFTLGTTSTRCQGANTVTYTATATNNIGITYTLDAASLAGSNAINPSTGAVSYDAAWTGTSVITATATGCNGPSTATHTVTITATVGTPVFTLGATSTRCQGAGTVTYTATATTTTGITYSLDGASLTGGNSIIPGTGVVTYAAAWSGTSTITASAAGCNGPKTAMHTVTITPTVGTPVFTLGATSTRCQGAGTITYTATATTNTGITYTLDAASITGGNAIDASTGEVTYAAGWSGTTTITATATGCNGPKTANHTVTVTASVGTPAFTLGATSTRCQGAGTVTYTATATTNTGITYTLDGASISGGNAINAGTGAVTYAAGWSGTSTITATAAGCNGPTTATHTVTITPTVGTPVFTLGATSTRCQGAGTVTYDASATTTTGITYSLNAASITGTNAINGSTGVVIYAAGWSGTSVITASAAGCGGPKTATHTVTVTPTVGTPVFTLGTTSTRCQGANTVTYTATATNNIGITYTLDAASLAGSNAINPSTGAVSYDAAWTGTSVITATATGCNGPSTATHTVTITATVGTPVFTLGATSTRCQGAGTVTYTATATTTTGITYSLDGASLTGGNSIIPGTGVVTYAAAWSGTSIITASAAGCNGLKTATHTVTITPTVGTPVFTLGATTTRCQGGGTVTYTATATTNTGITYTLDAASITGGNTIDALTGTVTYDPSWSGTSTITVTATGCNGPKTATHTVTITQTVGTPVFTLGAISTRCQGATIVTYKANATTSTGVTYALDSSSIAGGNSINTNNGKVTFVAGWSGTSTIIATATGCNGPTTASHTVTTTPTVGTPVFTLGATSTRCQGAGTVSYDATATTTTGITYTLDGASTTAGNTINSGSGAVTFVAGWSGTSTITASAAGCNGPKTATHTVTITPTVGTPVFTLGATTTRCEGANTVTYTATSTNNTGITYSLDGASVIGGNTINAATGAVTYAGTWSGTTVITASAAGCNGPKTATHTVTITPTVGTPIFTLGVTSTRCQGFGTVTYTATSTTNTGITYSLDATTSAFFGNSINTSNGAITYSPFWSGISTITTRATGCNGPVTSTHTVTTTPTVSTPVFALGSSSSRCQGANSVTYTATASNSTSITYSLDATSTTAGNTIDVSNGMVTYVANWVGTSVITAVAAGCNGPKSASHTVTNNPSVTTPVFLMGSSSTICQASGTVTYTATASNTSGITYSLDAASIAGSNFIRANGQLVYANTWSGTTIVTATAAGCNGPLTATHTVTVTPFIGTPTFALGSTSTRCQGAGAVAYTATASNAATMVYSIDATSTAAGNSINSSNGTVTYIAGWTGSSTITITATGCNGTTTATHTATTTPTVGNVIFALGASSTRCQGANTVTYTTTSTNNTGITYALDASTLSGGSTINALTGAVTYAAAWTGSAVITATATGCNGPKTATHTVNITPSVTTPIFTLGSTSTRCQNSGTVTYSASAFYSTGLTYSLDAASLAGGCTIAPGTGAVTYSSTWNGTATVTVSATGCNGPKTANHVVTITNNGTPLFLAGTTSTRCQGAATVSYPASTVGNSGVTYSLDVASTNAGNTINTATGSVTYVASWNGTSVITSTATGCAGVKTATHTVTITPNGAPTFALGSVSSRLQGAGIVTYSATSNNGGTITYSLDAASLAGGNIINSSTGAVTYTAAWNNATIITASVNGCNGVVSAIHTVSINSTVVTKNLYLSDPSQSLDRVDPVATNDLTTTSTASIGIGGGTGVVSNDNNQSGSVASGTTLTLSNFVTGSSPNRYMLVTVALTSTVNTITYGAQSLTKIGTMGAGKPRVELWQLVNPTAGTANVVITTAATGTIKAGVVTFSGVNPSTPYRTPIVTGTGGSSPSSMSVPSATGEIVCDILGSDGSGNVTINSGQTQLWGLKGPAGDMSGVSSAKAGAVSVNMAWNISNAPTTWVGIAVSVMPLPAFTGSVTFTQATPLCSSLNIKGGKTITVTNYVSVTNGAMPANPTVTATLAYGATNIITLSNPTYDNVAGTLIWTGTTASDELVPAGQAVSLTVASTQSGVGFTINYDSKAQPSKIDLPVSTYINIDSLNVFDAPYPGGKIIVSAISGANSYIRIKVSDPFGSNDINGVDLTITPPGTVIPATLVASSGCTRTYEYVWNTSGTNGSYNIFARAKEGFEGTVSALDNTSFDFCTFCPPVAVSDILRGKGGAPIQIDVLANDYDPNNNMNRSSLSIATQPRNGSAILASNKIVYLPNGNFAGKDTIVYSICDSTIPSPLCGTGQIFVTIDSTQIDPCSDASKSQTYYIPFPETSARTALLASKNTALIIDTLRTIISLKMPYPNMVITWDQWEDGYEANIMNPQQNTTKVWGDGNPYNGIAPGYPDDIIPAGGSIVLDNIIPCNPRVPASIFYDGKDKVFSSGQITLAEVTGEPSVIGLQCMKTNISSVSDFGLSFTIPAGENFNSQDFKYTALFVRASTNNTVVNVDRDNNNVFDTTVTLNEGESLFINGGVKNGATVASTQPIGVDVHFGGVDGYSSREVPIFPATWYSSLYYTPVPTTHSPDTAVVMLCNSLSRPLTINWSSGVPSSGTVVIPAEGVIRFPLALSATAAYKFQNLGGEAFTAIEIVDSYTPGGGGNVGSDYDWSFNLIAVERLTPYATIAWAPGSTDGTKNDNPIWVTPLNNTTIYVKYDGNVLSGGTTGPCGMHYDVSYPLNVLTHKRIKNPSAKNDQSGIAIYTCDGTKLAAVYGEDPSTANIANPSWDVGSTIQPFCAQKIILANDDLAYTMTGKTVTISVLDNDTSFLCTLDPLSVTNTGYLQPKNGTVSVNANGTLQYKPNPGYIGNDTLEYSVCSTPAPISVVCDVAQVIIIINSCPTPNNKNIISGQVFLDKSKDGINNDGGTGFNAAKIYLYADGNCNGVPTATELKDSVLTDASGSYQFLTYPELTLEDDFDGAVGASSCASGSDGSTSWAPNWVDAGDASSLGFCVTPAQPYNNTNVEMIKDIKVGGSFALRLKNPNVSATRTFNLTGATAAYLSFDYRRAAAINVGRDLLVQASSGGAYTTIYTIAGSGVADAAYSTVYYQNLLPYASATTSIRFLTSASYGNADTIYIDNIVITYLKYPQCYVTKVDPTSVPVNYSFTTASQNAFSLNAGGVCASPFDFGLAKTNISVGGTVYNDANGLTDWLVNGIAFGNPSGATLYAYLVDSTGTISYKTTVNSSTGAYSFSQADVTTTYSVVVSTADSALYAKAPSGAYLPSGWVATGENYGANNTSGAGNEPGLPNMAIAVKTGFSNVSGVNFGLEALPLAGSGTNTAINPGGTINVTVPANTFTKTQSGSDLSPGTITSIRVIAYPANATTMTINGTIYTPGNFPAGGLIVPVTSTGQPTQAILVDPYDNFVRVPIIYYAIDNANKESLLTGRATLQLVTDFDKDGIADGNDIDDDNDGITDYVEVCGSGATSFGCLVGGSDPSADNDNDGIVNYNDPDFGTLNSAGCVAILDKDGDGIPDYLDLDSDNDGIPDVVEANGVDVNGDGIIDNYSDTDGDGLSDNVSMPLLINGSFESPGQLLVGNNLTGTNTYNGWTSSAGTFNIVKTNGSVYTSGPDNAKSGTQYMDISGGASVISQPFSLSSASTISFGGNFSSRDATGYVNWTGKINILNSSGTVVATSSTRNFTSADATEDQLWYYLSGTATLPAGSYTYAVSLGDYGNFDDAYLIKNASGLGFVDFDGDGIPNSVDLDSDNDGIPDIVEAGGADTDNDGRLDTFTDANANGLNDASELAGAMLITGADTNNDGKADSYPNKNADKAGKSNPYDIDSDDDGIVDAIEAGFPYYVTISNGKVMGAAINGWAVAIQSLANLGLANSDNRGPANYLDIDSDDDGISDNIEGQPTDSYVLPADTDTDGDGLIDSYDVSVNSFGGNGISPYDHDSDGLPDYIDLDTDNDGALDLNEASHIFSINYANIITTDADGDGMLDQFDNLNLSSLLPGNRYRNVTSNNMGSGGTMDGPVPSGSLVQLTRSNPTGNRDWRAISVLPLHELILTGTLQQKQSNLVWNVEGGETTAFFMIERSINGITFSYVATVSSNRQASGVYKYTDDVKGILSGKIYYRIVQVDVNGDKQYSNVVVLKPQSEPEVVMKAFPNPVKDKFTLYVNSPVQQIITVLIMDVNGKTVLEKVLTVEKGANSFEFTNLANLSKGVYMIKAVIRDVYIIRFVKE